MNGDRIEMSQRERDRLKVLSPVVDGKRTQVEAARLLGLSTRQVRRILRRLSLEGDAGIVHRLRGHPSNARKCPQVRRQVLRVYAKEYPDFGPTFAAEKLTERGLAVTTETLRQWLLQANLWKGKRKRDKHRSRRPRRACFGELVQADGSHHEWLEGRGETMVLLVMIDDATSKTVARFYPGETTEGYMDLLGRYVRKRGRMVAMYTDKNSVFWGQAEGKEPAKTQFIRALKELAIKWIPAHSPQAKGRVERFNATAQDRLVKELRLAGATTMAEANEVLDKVFLPWFHQRCTVKPSSPNKAHRPLGPSMKLAAILSIQETRRVGNDYTIQLDNTVYQLLPPARPGLRGGRVIVEKRANGTLRIRFKGCYLPYEVVGSAKPSGALPPNPRGLSLGRTPAEGEEGCVAGATQPSAVGSTTGRSGCTPAEPCPPGGVKQSTKNKPYVPAPDHPWRKGFRRRKNKQKNRTVLLGPNTGHS